MFIVLVKSTDLSLQKILKKILKLYMNKLDKLPNVNYIGYKPNEYIKEICLDYDMFVYPSIFEETSCASALEALASGVHVITNNFGALYETCAEWPVYINYSTNYEQNGTEILQQLLMLLHLFT